MKIRDVREHLPVHVEPASFGWRVVEGGSSYYGGTSRWCLTRIGATRRAMRRSAYLSRLQQARDAK